jgi:subtilisin family serine protease
MPRAAKRQKEEFRLKLQPKLQMIKNGSSVVNAIRSEQCAALAVTREATLKSVPEMRKQDAVPVRRKDLPKSARRGRQKRVPSDIEVSVFVQTSELPGAPTEKISPRERARQKKASESFRKSFNISARRANLAIGRLKLSSLQRLSKRAEVAYVEIGQTLTHPRPRLSTDAVQAPDKSARRFDLAGRHRGGKDVLIGLIDVEGFDWAHPDFLDSEGKTRFVRIWDQGGDARPSPSAHPPFNYGAEFTQQHLNAALSAAPSVLVPPQQLEPQSQMAEASHGTHVASIAAGNSGICHNAKIAAVLISLPREDFDRRKSFYDSTRIAHAVDYLLELGKSLGLPVSINISLGTNGHAHDGSSAVSRWIDAALTMPGRCVSVAAGNAGQERGEIETDWGYVLGRVHTKGQIPARGLTRDIEWVVVGNGIADLSENEMEIWYSPQDRFAVSLRPPNSSEFIGPFEPGQLTENQQLPDGSFFSIYNELYHPANGCNYISLYLSPFLSASGIVGVPAGTWVVRLHGIEVRDGNYHAWIERDDPVRIGPIGPREAWRFPSFYSESSNVDESSISSLACGHNIIGVANLDEARERINITSSQGPTRDARTKPDVAAPGTEIVAARGFAGPDNLWVAMTGTSMAAPYVAGVAGLMLAVEPRLTAAQIIGIMQRTAQPLPGADFHWRNDAGFGAIQPNACLVEANRVNKRDDRTPRKPQ